MSKEVKVHYNHWIFNCWLFRRYAGIVIGRNILLRYTKTEMKTSGRQRILRHEKVHIEQMNKYTIVGFYIAYIMIYLFKSIRYFPNFLKAYREHPFEKEARDKAA